MGFAKGNVTVEGGNIKRFIGVANFKIHGVNLSSAELSELYGRTVEGERNFISEVDINGVKTKRVRLNFTASTMIEDKPEFFNIAYSLVQSKRVGATSGKEQVIDEYGRTAWVTPEELSFKAVPTYANGPANITGNYRNAYSGEEYLTDFLRYLMNIPDVTKFDPETKKPVGLIDHPEDAEARLEQVSKYFDGDWSEISDLLKSWPENKVKMLVGVRKDDQNRLWQDFFINFPMRANVRNYTKLQAALKEAQDGGLYAGTEFEICDLKEYVETPSTFGVPSAKPTAPAGGWFTK